MGWMRKLTALSDRVRGARGVAAGAWDGEVGRRQRLVGVHYPGGVSRHLFGVGEGPTEAVAEAKQETDNDYPRSFATPVRTSARTAALICSGIWGQAATISASSGLASVMPPD